MRAIIDGGRVPKGTVRVSGAKNAATRLLAAATLADGPVLIENFPASLVDAGHKARFIADAGGVAALDVANATATVDARGMTAADFGDWNYPVRTTYLLVAAQILRGGLARIPYPGGCRIGARGYDMHLMVWRRLGCEVTERETHIEVRGARFIGAEIVFPISTVGGTENALLCASVARGTSEIVNAYITPEIEDLIDLLRRMGADIEVTGNSRIRVTGKPTLSTARKTVMPDRIEALTWIVYAILSRGTLLIEDVPFEAMRVPLVYFEAAGIDMLANRTSLYIHPDTVGRDGVQPFEVPCGAHPGVISDMQPFFVLLALAARGVSRIYDYRYPERIAYARELARFLGGGSITAEPGRITVEGPAVFRAARASSTDLRGSMAAIVAALCAPGTSVVNDAQMALRGYDRLADKLAALGIDIAVEDDERPERRRA
jgi:UDP-N-acetylglucosamine 1-carboxyvinyltransferase